VTAAQQVAAAREFLDGARRRKVSETPHSVLVREAAELRRQLGLVLDLIGEDDATLTGPVLWKPTVRQALIDAVNWREQRPDHPDAADQVALYVTAARALGIDLGPGGAS
jgi:hypothetical protein